MTVIVKIGRRVPKSWYRRLGSKVKGLMTFQENMWQMIIKSLDTAKKKAQADGRMKFIIQKEKESEDLNYELEWKVVTIQGTPAMEEDEYNDTLKMYDRLSKNFKKDIDKDDKLASYFKTKVLSPMQLNEAYKQGYGTMENNNIANKLLEMGIVTHVEWNKDFDTREEVYY